MAIGIVSQELFEQECKDLSAEGISRIDRAIPDELVMPILRGRGNKNETPEHVRAFIASEAICGANVKELANDMDVSHSSISAYKNGATSTASYNKPDAKLQRSNDEVREKIVGIAQGKLVAALKSIKLTADTTIKPREAAQIAQQMSSVVKNLQPNTDNSATVNNQVVIFRPRTRAEDEYETIEIRNE